MLRILACYWCLFFLAATLLPAWSLIRNPEGTLEIFTLGANGYVYHGYLGSSGGAWSTTGLWPSIGGGGLVSPPSVVVSSNGVISQFATGSDGNVRSNYRIPGSNWATTGAWGSLSSNGNFVGAPVAVSNTDGTVEVFALGADGNVYHDYQTSSTTGAWYTGGAWPSLGGGGLASPPAVVVSSNGIVSLFAMGSDGNIHVNYKLPGSGWATTGTWGPLSTNGSFAGTPLAITDGNGYVEVFAWGVDGNFYHDAQISSSAWYTVGTWPTLGGDGILLGSAPPPKLLPGTPAKEYVYFNGQVIAVENAGP